MRRMRGLLPLLLSAACADEVTGVDGSTSADAGLTQDAARADATTRADASAHADAAIVADDAQPSDAAAEDAASSGDASASADGGGSDASAPLSAVVAWSELADGRIAILRTPFGGATSSSSVTPPGGVNVIGGPLYVGAHRRQRRSSGAVAAFVEGNMPSIGTLDSNAAYAPLATRGGPGDTGPIYAAAFDHAGGALAYFTTTIDAIVVVRDLSDGSTLALHGLPMAQARRTELLDVRADGTALYRELDPRTGTTYGFARQPDMTDLRVIPALAETHMIDGRFSADGSVVGVYVQSGADFIFARVRLSDGNFIEAPRVAPPSVGALLGLDGTVLGYALPQVGRDVEVRTVDFATGVEARVATVTADGAIHASYLE